MKQSSKVNAILRIYWRFLRIYLFYPLMIGAFIYVYIKGYHWIWGLLIIVAILSIDPTYRLLWRGLRRHLKAKNKGR